MDDQAPSVPDEASSSALELDVVMARDFVSLNMSSELSFVTPKKACKQSANPQFSSSEVCAVCLSPLLHRKQREDNEYEVATTKCEVSPTNPPWHPLSPLTCATASLPLQVPSGDQAVQVRVPAVSSSAIPCSRRQRGGDREGGHRAGCQQRQGSRQVRSS